MQFLLLLLVVKWSRAVLEFRLEVFSEKLYEVSSASIINFLCIDKDGYSFCFLRGNSHAFLACLSSSFTNMWTSMKCQWSVGHSRFFRASVTDWNILYNVRRYLADSLAILKTSNNLCNSSQINIHFFL